MRKDRTKYFALPRVVIFVYNDNKLLLIEKSIEDEHGRSSPVYYPIGGHVEPGEEILSAAQREVEEETGIKKITPKLKAIIYNTGFDNYQIILFIFILHVKSRNTIESKEGKLLWVDTDELGGLNVFEDVQIFHKEIKRSSKDEILYGTSAFKDFQLKEVVINGKKLY